MMRSLLLWTCFGIPVVAFAGYFALTVGTRFFLPSEWKAIEIGMARDEVRKLIPNDWAEPYFQTRKFGPLHLTIPPTEWMFSRNEVEESTGDFMMGRIGLRSWYMSIEYQNGIVSDIGVSQTDEISLWRAAVRAWWDKVTTGNQVGTGRGIN